MSIVDPVLWSIFPEEINATTGDMSLGSVSLSS